MKIFHLVRLVIFVLIFAGNLRGAEQIQQLSKYEIILLSDVEKWQLSDGQGQEEWNAATTTFITKCYQRGLKTENLSSYTDKKEELRKLDASRVLFAIPTWTHIKTKKMLRDAYEVRATIFFKDSRNEVIFTASGVTTKRDWKQALQLSFLDSYEQFLAAHPGFDKSTNFVERRKQAGPGPSRANLLQEMQDRIDSLKPVEGLWATLGATKELDSFEVAIIRHYGSEVGDFSGYLTKSSDPKQMIGHVRLTVSATAVAGVYQGLLVDPNMGTEPFDMVQESINLLGIALKPRGQIEAREFRLIRIFPKYAEQEKARAIVASTLAGGTAEPKLTGSGSGFLVDTQQGLIVTNFHVIENAKKLRAAVAGEEFDCNIVTADRSNDLVILKLVGFENSSLSGKSLPYALRPSSVAREGTRVFTMGFPLGALLGTKPKFSDGSISSLAGMNDDPRILQMNVPIQPGNSGGPLLTNSGELIGVVVAALDAKYFIENIGIVPQNVNFAVKSDYLGTLFSASGVKSSTISEGLRGDDLIQAVKVFCVSVQNWQ
jgi:S1-C subfamily serine protease